ncbi:flavodoxin [Kaistia dalseonensis]|uniref:Flavodoxin n=1 Tax=Kaistia dalseonensis TaxID=410840 RepID=A0ABU0H7Q1_9HYPH|nr:flavodoxin [Kaistia dalseonensis]MCX5495736.1 flavodoxin [Kaistia dalseonensis]MDQ0438333.1 flavodoxin [Kaistia dalseonensis]
MSELKRRTALQALALAPVMAVLGAVGPARALEGPSSASSLVAYFSRTGNTRVIAGQIRRATGSVIFEIAPAVPYPEDYEQTVGQARQETADGFRPPLRASVEHIDQYETIYLGLPVWGTTAPPVIRAFLAAHDLRGKTLVPFITHGGYGVGSSVSVIAGHAPGARIAAPFVMEADQERRTLEQVTGWLGKLTP